MICKIKQWLIDNKFIPRFKVGQPVYVNVCGDILAGTILKVKTDYYWLAGSYKKIKYFSYDVKVITSDGYLIIKNKEDCSIWLTDTWASVNTN